jgi:hypothetical protein
MRYFFDIHCNGEAFLDDKGREFPTGDEARQYVVACGRICLAEGTPEQRAVMRQCIIEITDREGLSDVVMLADCLPRLNPRHVLQQAVRQYGIG